MPHEPKNHKDNQVSLLCGLCLAKSKHLRNITDTTLERIQKVFEDLKITTRPWKSVERTGPGCQEC